MIDVDAVTWELYGLLPAEFTAAREESTARARKEGDASAVKRITALRKPTVAAWSSNLLVRAEPAQAEELLRLGEALRTAHRTLAGEELRELSHRQHGVIAAMARQARRLAGEAGHPVSEAVQREVEQILHTVLADPDAAAEWARGTLSKAPPPPTGFTGLDIAPDARPPRPAQPPQPASADRPAVPEAKRARAQAQAAGREAAEAEDRLRLADEELARSREPLDALDEQIADLERRLAQVKEERRRARAEAGAAERRHRDAARVARAARKAADDAARAAARPEPGADG
ncbi:hypothetical protein ACFWBF_29435 [Streptomyces sp. NPDC060028]|uniref:hypothetical protein n=1 Tax=Streptomyces sp. NPDC060028 TaxID=3347041 RepID=UPI0036856708